MRNKYFTIIIALLIINLTLAWQVYANGAPDSPGPPDSTSSYTLANLYNRLNTGTFGSQSTFTEPDTAPGTSTMHTLNEIMAIAPLADKIKGARASDVLVGKTYWGLRPFVGWGPGTGTMPDNGAVIIAPGSRAQPIAAGYHNGAGAVVGDPDLVAENIRSGINLFGINGSLVKTAIPVQSAVPKTGQTTCHNAAGNFMTCTGTGQDGEYQLGTNATLTPAGGPSGAYLVPGWAGIRFIDNGDGTVLDTLTGLIWLKNANCYGLRDWETALILASIVANGSCGLSDDSGEGEWRLPNINELHSLIDLSQSSPALPSEHPFSDVQAAFYWSSTSNEPHPPGAWGVNMNNGVALADQKIDSNRIWFVRGGQ